MSEDPSGEDVLGGRRFAEAYYLAQYERIDAHQNRWTQVSSFVTAGTVLSVGSQISADVGSGLRLTFVCALIAVNVLAALYVTEARSWVKVHQARARGVLRVISPDLLALQSEATLCYGFQDDAANRNSWIRLERILVYMHSSIVSALLVYAAILFSKMLSA